MSQLITNEVLNSGKKFRIESSSGGTLREAKMSRGRAPIVIMETADEWRYPDLDLVAEILPTKSVNTNNQYVALKVSGSDLYIKNVPNQAIFRLTGWDDVEYNKALFAFYRTPSNAIKIKCVLDFPGAFWKRGYLKAGDKYLEADDPQGSDFNLRYFSSAPVQSLDAITVAAPTPAPVPVPFSTTPTSSAPVPAPVPVPVPAPFSTTPTSSAPVPAPFSMTPTSNAPVPAPVPKSSAVPMEEGIPWWVWLIVVLILLGIGVFIFL